MVARARAWWLAWRVARHVRAVERARLAHEGRRLALMLAAPKEGGGRWFG